MAHLGQLTPGLCPRCGLVTLEAVDQMAHLTWWCNGPCNDPVGVRVLTPTLRRMVQVLGVQRTIWLLEVQRSISVFFSRAAFELKLPRNIRARPWRWLP